MKKELKQEVINLKNNSKMRIIKNSKGITLIALVITIIVLLILASVSIAMLTGDNGILENSTKSKEETKISKIKESISLAWTECESDYQLETEIDKVRSEFYTEENLNAKIKEGNIADLKYNEKDSSFMLYNTNDGIKYNVKIVGSNIILNKDTTNINDTKNWLNCRECSEYNPHIITNKYEFDSIRTHINTEEDGNENIGGYFKLANDIYFYDSDFKEDGDFYNGGNGFIPIGLKEGPYENLFQSEAYKVKINFDGNNKELVNIKINTQELQRDYNSIFARLDKNGIIKNLNINNLEILAPTSVGGMVRALYEGAELNSITLKNSKCMTTKSMGNMKSSGLVAGYIEGNAYNLNLYNSSFISNSWYGAGISGQIKNTSNINGITMDKCNIKTYVEGGMIAGNIMEGTIIKNINVADSSYTYTHTDPKRAGILFQIQTQENKENPVIFKNLNIKNLKYNENLKRIIGVGYGKLIDSNIKLNNKDQVELIKENIILENSIIEN